MQREVNKNRYLSSGCKIYPKRVPDVVQRFIPALQNPTNLTDLFTHVTLSFLNVLDLGWSLAKAYNVGWSLEYLIKCVGAEMRVALDRSSTHQLVTSDSFWREIHTTTTVYFCDTSARTKICILSFVVIALLLF